MKELYKKRRYMLTSREKKEGQTQLLICTHQGVPEAGVRVPGGTVRQGETLEDALLRKIQEESGLRQVSLGHLVADELIYVKDKKMNIRSGTFITWPFRKVPWMYGSIH
ncbi:hypothetical protein GCM10020331_066030 [Ectobacillus funiculus]